MLIGVQWGVIGVAASVSIAAVLLRYPSIWYCCNVSPLEQSDVLAVIWRPAAASLVAAGCVWGVIPMLPTQELPIVTLALELAIYAASYPLCWVILPGGARSLREIASLLQDVRSRGRSRPKSTSADGEEPT